jgi:Bacterial cell division membrane protein
LAHIGRQRDAHALIKLSHHESPNVAPCRAGIAAYRGDLCLFLGTDLAKGAGAWYALACLAQPSEILNRGFVVVSAWMLGCRTRKSMGPPGRMYSFILAICIAMMLALQPDFGQACLVLFAWGVMYFVAGAPDPFVAGYGGAGRFWRHARLSVF